MENNIVKNRSEILFLYEVENTNPNGDPLNENRPRYDTEDSKELVSDVRLKRTIRDYWYEYKKFNGQGDNQDIFIREIKKADGNIYTGKDRAKDFKNNPEYVLEKCIDIRVFGGVIPLDKDSITFTGPTQFQMGKSLHKTKIEQIQGTGAFASSDKKKQKAFRTEFVVPYALIGFYGVINEKAAQYTKMSEQDKQLLLEAIWEGTKNLISRSKFGQNPVLLLVIDYKEPFLIGNLRQRVKLITKDDMNDMQIRSINDYVLDVTELLDLIEANKDKIEKIELKKDPRLKLIANDEEISEIKL